VVVLISSLLVVCKILREDSDGTPEHEKEFKGHTRTLYCEMLPDVGVFPFLLCLIVLLYRKAIHDFEPLQLWSCLDSSIHTPRFWLSSQYHLTVSDITYV